MANCFVSHSSKDRAQSELVHRRLRDAGHRVFLDTDLDDGIQPAEGWEARLWRELALADVLVFVNSPAGQQSLWCRDELQRGKQRGIPLYSVAISDDVGPYKLIDTLQGVTGPTFEARVDRAVRSIDALDRASWNPERPPYPGLAAFEPDDEAVFFGRTEDIAYLRRLLGMDDPANGQRLLMMGPSGVGKSSLVRAGLLPSVRRHRGWKVVTPRLVPPDLHASVLDALRDAGGGDTGSIVDRARRITGQLAPPARLLLVIDQAEDLLLPDVDVARRDALVAELQAATAGHSPVSTLVSFREDRLAEMKAVLPHFLESGLTTALVVNRMPMSRVTELIEGPALVHALTLDPGLAGRLRDDASSSDDRVHALPLIAFTLSEMYRLTKERGDYRLTIRDYEEVGQFKGAVATAAIKTEAKITDSAALDSLLLDLVNVNEQGVVASRTRLMSELTEAEHAVAEILADDRLVTLSEDERGQPVARLVHDRLATDWPRLSRLIDSQRDDLQMKYRLERQAEEFHDGQRDALPPDATKEARTWLERQPLDAELEPVRALVKESRRRHRRRRFAWQTTGAIVVSLALVAVAFGVQSRRAASVNRAGALDVAAQGFAASGRPFDALAAAYQSLRTKWNPAAERTLRQSLSTLGDARRLRTQTRVGPVAFSTRGTVAVASGPAVLLWNPVTGEETSILRTPRRQGFVDDVAYSANETFLVISYADRELWAYNVTDRSMRQLEGQRSGRLLGFPSDGRRLVAIDSDVQSWDLASLKLETRSLGTGQVARALRSDGAAAIVHDATRGAYLIVDVNDPAQPSALIDFAGPSPQFGFSADRARVTAIDENAAFVFDARTGRRSFSSIDDPQLRNHVPVAFDANATRLVVITPGSAVAVYRLAERTLEVLGETPATIRTAEFSPDSRTLVVATTSGQFVMWDTASRLRNDLATDPLGGGTLGSFSPDGRYFAIRGVATDLWLFDVGSAEPNVLVGLRGDITSLAFADQSDILAAADSTGAVVLWDAHTGVATQLDASVEPVDSLALSADGETVVASTRDSATPVVWRPPSPEPKLLDLGGAMALSVATSSSGDLVAAGDETGVIVLWDARTGSELARTQTDRAAGRLTFDADERKLLIGSTGSTPAIWTIGTSTPVPMVGLDADETVLDTVLGRGGTGFASMVVPGGPESGNPIEVVRWGIDGSEPVSIERGGIAVDTIALSDDGKLVAGGSAPAIGVWDVRGAMTHRLRLQAQPISIAFDSTGGSLLAELEDGSFVAWNLATDEHLTVATSSSVALRAVSPSRQLLATAHRDNSVRLWPDIYFVDRRTLLTRAAQVLGPDEPRTTLPADLLTVG